MRLGYYKYYLKELLFQSYLKFKFRKKNLIGKNCYIDHSAILGGNVKLSDFVRIEKNVVLHKNVCVGNYALISNIEIGPDSVIESGVICTGYGKGKISVGVNSYIGINNILDWSNNITIGDYVHIAGPSTGLWTHSSAKMCLESKKLTDKKKDCRPTAPIKIEDNVYIGGNCTIYPGVTIHHHSIITPNSVVTKDVKSYCQVGGVPAKFIKKINDIKTK